MARSIQWIACFLLFVSPLLGQQGTMHFNHLTLAGGLNETTNAYVYLDSKGFVWISSLTGLNRFDGIHVKVFTENPEDSSSIKNDHVTSSFYEEDSSRLWFTTSKGVNAYDWKTNSFRAYIIPKENEKVIEGYFAFYLDPDLNLWLLCDKYLYTFNIPTASFHKLATLDKECHRAIAMPDASGHVKFVWGYYLNRTGAEEIVFDHLKGITSHKTVFDSVDLKPFKVKDFIRQGDSLLWVLSDDAIWKYNVIKQRGRFIPLKKNDATTFEVFDENTLFIGFKKSGLHEFNIRDEKLGVQYVHQPDNASSLLNNTVDDINIDRQGVIWVSSWGNGISYTQPRKRKFTTFYPHALATEIKSFNPITLIPVKPNVLLCGTRSDGFYYFYRTAHEVPEIDPVPHLDSKSLQGNVAWAFNDNSGNSWICTYPGASVFNPKSGTLKHLITSEQDILFGIPWRDHTQLLCGRGLMEVKGNMQDGFNVALNKAVSHNLASWMLWHDSRNRLWIATELSGILVYDADNFSLLDTVPATGIFAQMIERDSSIWLCSDNGLYEIDIESLDILKLHNKSSDLPASAFSSMIMDQQKRLWLTYNQGILLFDPSRDSIHAFNEADGLPPLQFRRAAHQFEDGEIWFTTNEGITRFYPDKIHDLDIQAIPQITEIQVNDSLPKNKLVCEITGSSNFPLIQKLIFKYADNTLAFRINSLEYSSPNRNKVKYQMENLDAQLLETASGSLVRYPNLPPGDYTFVVYASNSDGIYNTASRSISIHINAPFYKTWLFYILVAMFAIGIVAYIIYLRFTKALELQRVRLKLYENLHDDVGSRLTAIVLSAEDLERNEKINSPKVQSISKIAKSIVENMRRLVWAIDPENDKMNTILQKITHDKSLILGDGVEFHIHLDDHLKNVIVAGEIRYQISSICNEAFNNIAKYAKATAVNVSLSRENKKFRLTITDNGKGFDPSLVTKNSLTGSGYGLDNMKRRASRVKGNLEIFSKPGEGTRIVAEFPY